MQSQFTDKAKAALLLAEKTAKKLRQGYVGTEHILVGLMQEEVVLRQKSCMITVWMKCRCWR